MRRDSLDINARRTTAASFRSVMLAVAAIAGAVGAVFMLAPAAASAQTASVAFTSFRDGAAHVYAVNADGTGVRALTRTRGAAFEGSPAYSPDGRRIAYTCGNFELCVMNADGSAQARLTTNDWPRELRYDTNPAWSPDGATIAFVRTVAGKDGIWLVAPNGSGLRQLPVPAGVNASPSFSADSRLIAYEHAEDQTGDDDLPSSSDHGIQVIGVDGSALRTLTGPGVDASDPAWSPDGTRIAFTRSYEDDDDKQIVVIDADGSDPRRVTSRRADASDPAWSADSTRIVFTRNRAGAISLYHVAATGGRQTRLTTGRGADLDPACQPSAPTTPAQQAMPTAGPPAVATADARTVGLLLRAFAGLVPVVDAFSTSEKSANALVLAAGRTDRYARQITTAARSLKPTSRRARSVRRTVLQSMSMLKGIATATRQWSRSIRRHDRRAARKHREKVLFGLAFGALIPLGTGVGDAGMSQAML